MIAPAFCEQNGARQPASTCFAHLRAIALLLAAAGLSSLAAAQTTAPSPTAQPPPTPKQTENLTARQLRAKQKLNQVALDVTVEDAQGHPIHGLKASDFTLLEDDQQQTISTLQEHTPADPLPPATEDEAPQPAPAPNTFTDYHFVPRNSAVNILLLDSLNTSTRDPFYFQKEALKRLKSVPPGMPFAVFFLGSRLHLLQGFSKDPDALAGFLRDGAASLPAPYGPSIPPDVRAILVDQSLQQISSYLGDVRGRVNLIWLTGNMLIDLSDGIRIGNPFPDITTSVVSKTGTYDLLTLGRTVFYPVDARPLINLPGFTNPNLNHTAFYLVDPNSKQAYPDTAKTMSRLAAVSGGRAFEDNQGLDRAVAEVVGAGSNFYTISYIPKDQNWNGLYRTLKIKVDRTGCELGYRPGYFALMHHSDGSSDDSHRRVLPLPYKAKSPTLPRTPMQKAMSPYSLPVSQLLFAAKVASIPQKISSTSLPRGNQINHALMKFPCLAYQVNYSVHARDLSFTTNQDGSRRYTAEFVAAVYDQSGQIVDATDEVVNGTFPANHAGSPPNPEISMSQIVPVPVKGIYFMRIGVRDIATERVGTIELSTASLKDIAAHSSPLPQSKK